MEAYEALIVGVLGLSALYAWQRRRDPMDKWLALVTLWICVTGSIGMVLAQLDDPWRFVRLALRLSGPPLLLVVCEESVRTSKTPGSRRTSFIFAGVIWVVAVGALIYYDAGTIVELQLPFLDNTQVGVTAWMAMLAVCFFSALLTVVPSLTRGVNPGFAGFAATLILFSESWAAIDPRWGSGALTISENLTYRSLLTFALAFVGLAKAYADGLRWLMSGAATDPPEGDSAKERKTFAVSTKKGSSKKKSAPAKSKPDTEDAEEDGSEEEDEEDTEAEPPEESDAEEDESEEDESSRSSKKPTSASSSQGPTRSKSKAPKSGKKKKKKGGKK